MVRRVGLLQARQPGGRFAAAGSTHTDFETETGATYIVIFKI